MRGIARPRRLARATRVARTAVRYSVSHQIGAHWAASANGVCQRERSVSMFASIVTPSSLAHPELRRVEHPSNPRVWCPPQQCLQRRSVCWGDLDEKPGRRLGKQSRAVGKPGFGHRDIAQVDLQPMTARDRHLGGGDRQAAFTQVMTGLNQSLAIGAVDGAEDAPRGGETHDRRSASLLAVRGAARAIRRDHHR